jgi:amino acid transporter
MSAIVHSHGYAASAGSYLSAFLTASLAGLFCCYGFEACGDVAEETPNPGVVIPKSMRMTIYIGISAAFFICLALVLAVPDVKAAIAGTDKDPLATILTSAFGPLASKAVIAIVMVSFVSCVLSLQAAASRLLFSFARDRNIVASDFLQRLSPRTHVPVGALLVSGVVPAVVSLLTLLLSNQAIQTIISFAVIGIYVAFQMVVLGALYARVRGWKPAGPFTLGAYGWVVNLSALLWGVFAVGAILRPITPDAPWYQNYAMTLTTAVVVGVGLAYMLLLRPHTVSQAPSGDAYPS